MRQLLVILFLIPFFFPILSVSQDKTTDSQLAMQYMQNGDFEKAAILYENLYNRTNSQIYFNFYIKSLYGLKDFKRAEKALKKQLKNFPGELGYFVELGNLYKMAEKFKDAESTFQSALAKISDNSNQVLKLATAFEEKREFAFAEKTYLEGRKKVRGEKFRLELANIFGLQHNYEKMIEEFLSILSEDPEKLAIVENKLQNYIANDIDDNIKDFLRVSLLKRIQSNSSETIFSELLIWYFLQEKNFRQAIIQVIALDRRYNENGERLINLADLANSNKSYDIAIQAYQYVIEKGMKSPYYQTARFGLLSVYYSKVVSGETSTNKEIIELENSYLSVIKELGKNPQTIKLIKDLAHLQAFYLNKKQEALDLLESVKQMGGASAPLLAECNLELGDILLLTDEPWEATIIYAQVEEQFKNHPLGHEAKFRKAKLAYYTGNFQWALAQLDILKASTSKLIANDACQLSLLITDNTTIDSLEAPLKIFAQAELLLIQNKDSLAILTLDTLLKRYPGHSLFDDVYYKFSQIMKKKREYNKALEYLNIVVDNYSYDVLADRALFDIAEIYEKNLGNKEKAMDLYKDVLVKFPGSIYVIDARKRYRELRGDKVNLNP